jgi:hypothetical protein
MITQLEHNQFSETKNNCENTEIFSNLRHIFHETTLEEQLNLESIVGDKVVPYLTETVGAKLFTDERMLFVQAKYRDADENNFSRLMSRLNTRYVRNDYVTVIDKRFIMLATWKKITSNKTIPDKVIQLDFMNFSDWLNPNESNHDSYFRSLSKFEIGGSGLYIEAQTFLKKLKSLAKVVNPDCLIQICSADETRERIFRLLLKDLPNILFV